MKLGDLSRDIGILSDRNAAGVEINHITHDSRKVQHGTIFVAIEGALRDGHDYIACASQLGAVCIVTRSPEKVPCCIPVLKVEEPRKAMAQLARRLYGYPDRKLKVIGITGTNGKTTCTYLLNHVLAPLGVCGRMGTVSYYNGESEEKASRTTPEASDAFRSLSEMVSNGCRYAALEMSSHGLELGRVLGMDVHYALFTNLSQDHLDFHKDMDTYFAAKQLLFTRHLVEGGTAIVNWDDEASHKLDIPSHANLIRLGTHPDAELRFEIHRADLSGIHFDVYFQGKKQFFDLPLMGRHNVYNFCGALAVAVLEGRTLEEVASSISDISSVPGRTEKLNLGQKFSVIIDFAHTPDALQNVLQACRDMTTGRLILVFGAGGDRDTSKRAEMGAAADRLADVICLTSDNPRMEDPEAIMDMVQAGIERPLGNGFMRTWDREQAIRECIEMAREGDTVLIAGKGHETAQEIGGRFRPFDDRLIASNFIQAVLEAGHG